MRTGPIMEKAVSRSTALGTLKIAHRTALGMKYWIGTRTATGRTTLPISDKCPCRVLAVEAVVVPADEWQSHQHADAADGADEPALEGVEAEALLEVEVAQHRAR